ncbi:LCP family protein [Streptomyces brevispora]|uniref:LCP family protein n=1 Tax=Streptomyces brevispora TaxID=887462 RepID=A0ABZ1G6A6_9ACTN|nr:LCP family protein [Streptomyces brevispora]WSC15443.1 LCP family protein [Streptomyces brevispora]
MGRSSTPGEGTRPRVRHAGQLGWDDGLYEDRNDDAVTPDAEGAGDGGSVRRGDGRRGRSHRAGKRKKRRVLRWTALVLAVLILGTGAAGYLWYEHLNGNLRKGHRSAGNSSAKKTAPNAAGQTPLNILLIGSDSRNTAENLKLGGSKSSVGGTPLADVQMLLHVSADRKNASVVSIPRDTRVNIPACEDPNSGHKYPATNDLINTTLGRGGPGCTLDTWETLTGVYIDHWMLVDFAGVVSMADAVGGAEVCVKQDVHDVPKPNVPGGSYLKLTKGPHKIKGKQALQWLRTRHAFESDFGRSKAQHMYMNSVIRELKDQNAFTDTGRLMSLAETATKSLQVSEEIGSVKKLFDLGMQLKGVPMDKMNMLTMPRIPDPGNANHVLAKPGAADKLWALLRDDESLDPKDRAKSKKKKESGPAAGAPASLGVTVVNGTAADGQAPTSNRAAGVRDLLRAKGFTEAATSTTPGSALTTEVTYPKSSGPQGRSDAVSIAKALSMPTSVVKEAPDGDELTLTVGSDWRTGSTFPKAAADDSDPLEGTEAVNGAKTGCMDVYWPYRQM